MLLSVLGRRLVALVRCALVRRAVLRDANDGGRGGRVAAELSGEREGETVVRAALKDDEEVDARENRRDVQSETTVDEESDLE